MSKPKKTDVGWERYFDSDNTLATIERDGYVYVDANRLKRLSGGMEPRLLAKQDTLATRPKIFRQYDLTIFPVKNGRYIIFRDKRKKSYHQFSDKDLELPVTVYQPNIDLLNFDSYPADVGITGESQAIDFAYISSLLRSFVGETEMHLTIRGRSRSSAFQFQLPESDRSVSVSGVQIEVDAGYESDTCIYLIEAKVGKRDDFHIRQLYYPYLEWSGRSPKKIRSIFLAFSNQKYFLYEFDFKQTFGDLRIVRTGCFALEETMPARISLSELLPRVVQFEEPSAPFPQADDLDRVIDVVSLVSQGIDNKSAIAEYFEFAERQGDYYPNAAIYLGLIERASGGFQVTGSGKEFLGLKSPSAKTQFIVARLLERPALHEVVSLLAARDMDTSSLSKSEVAQLIRRHREDVNETTSRRRASSVLSWLNWMINVGVTS